MRTETTDRDNMIIIIQIKVINNIKPMDHSNIPYSSFLEFSYSRLYTRALVAILGRFMTQTRATY